MNHSELHDARDTIMPASKAARACVRWASAKPCEVASRHGFVLSQVYEGA